MYKRQGSYRGNFKTLDEVSDFLNQVRKKTDEDNAYTVAYQTLEGQIGGILTADLKKAENEDDPVETGEKETQDMQASSLAGVSLESATQLLDAVTSDAADFYETGVLDMAFVENIEVYENYVQSDAFTTADAVSYTHLFHIFFPGIQFQEIGKIWFLCIHGKLHMFVKGSGKLRNCRHIDLRFLIQGEPQCITFLCNICKVKMMCHGFYPCNIKQIFDRLWRISKPVDQFF